MPEVDGVDAARDAWELALVRRRHRPEHARCSASAGARQVINVAAGGTLIPHLGAVTEPVHRDRERFDQVIHPVDVLAGQPAGRRHGPGHAGVNTLHHQAVDEVGLGLRAVAWSPTTASSRPSRASATPGVLGVQWHPELLPDRARPPRAVPLARGRGRAEPHHGRGHGRRAWRRWPTGPATDLIDVA